jgi:UDP-glucose 4-epimerase
MPKYKSALVTGGAGFIGSHIVDALIARHIRTYVVDDLSRGRLGNVNPNAKFFKMSVVSPSFPALVKKIRPEVVFHAAAQVNVRCSVDDPPTDARVNILGTIEMAHAASQAGVKKIILSSSGGVMYPERFRPPYSEKIAPEPISPYGIAKRAAEMYLEYEHFVHGVPYAALRYANVYGPRQDSRGEAGVVAVFSERLLTGRPALIHGDGRQTRDFVYVGDVVRANLLALQKSAVGIFNIGTGKETNINTIFRKLKQLTGSSQEERHAAACEGEVRRSSLDARRAARYLDWRPSVHLDDGLEKTVDWFRTSGVGRL